MIHYIYTIVNTINGKVYVGYTHRRNPVLRWRAHITMSKTSDRPLYRAMRKYGIEHFIFEVIYCSHEYEHTLHIMENHFINEYEAHISNRNGYNITMGGQGNNGWSPSTETREKISKGNKGKFVSDETKKKQSESMNQLYISRPELREIHRKNAIERGATPPRPTQESIKNAIKTRTGKPIHTDERKLKLSEDFKNPEHVIHSAKSRDKAKRTWEEMGRCIGERNGNAVFANVYDPIGEMIASGFLQKICDDNSLPFKTFLRASRHGNPLERGVWKGWKIIRMEN